MNSGNLWKVEQERKLKELYADKPKQETDFDFVVRISPILRRSVGSVRGKLNEFRRTRELGVIPESNYKIWDDLPNFEGNALILNDLHIPYHHAGFINRCLDLANHWQIPMTVLGGDTIEANAFSGWADDFSPDMNMANAATRSQMEEIFLDMPEGETKDKMAELLENLDAPAGDMSEELTETRKVIKAFTQATNYVLRIQGNHENRTLRVLKKSLNPSILDSLLGGDNPRWKISAYYECEFISGSKKWRVTHPVNSGKGSSKKLASKYQCNIVMAHDHHLSIQSDPSGQFLAIEAGACVDRRRLPYEMQRDNAADMHMLGAVIIRDGLPHLLNDWTDWKQLMK